MLILGRPGGDLEDVLGAIPLRFNSIEILLTAVILQTSSFYELRQYWKIVIPLN